MLILDLATLNASRVSRFSRTDCLMALPCFSRVVGSSITRGERTGLDGILTRGAEQLRQILFPESALPHPGTAADLRAVDVQGQVLFIDGGVRRPVCQGQLAALVDVRISERSYKSDIV